VGPAHLLLELQQPGDLEGELDLLRREIGDALQVASLQIVHLFLPFALFFATAFFVAFGFAFAAFFAFPAAAGTTPSRR
jgi:hypothetical protein